MSGKRLASPTQELEGWGMRAYKFSGGNGAAQPMVQPTQFGVTGTVMSKDSATELGLWTN